MEEEAKTPDDDLLHAILFRTDEAVDEALAKGANPNCVTKVNVTGDAALHVAVRRKKSTVPCTLLIAGADPNIQSNALSTPLSVASMLGNADHVEALLHYGANPLLRGSGDATALHSGAACRERNTLSALMRGGVPMDVKNSDGETADVVAQKRGFDFYHDFKKVKEHLGASIIPADMPGQADKSQWLDVEADRGEFNIQNIGFWHNFEAAADALDAAGQGLHFRDKKLSSGEHLMDKAAHFFRIPDALNVLHKHDIRLQPEDMIKPDGQPYEYIKSMAKHGTLGQLFALPLWEGRSIDELRACQAALTQHFPDEMEKQISNSHQLTWHVQRQSAEQGQGR